MRSQISIANYLGVVQPKLTEREAWVMEAVEELYPCSAEMVAEHYGVGVNVISGRFTGLKNKGKIVLDHYYKKPGGSRVGYYRPKAEHEYADIS